MPKALINIPLVLSMSNPNGHVLAVTSDVYTCKTCGLVGKISDLVRLKTPCHYKDLPVDLKF